MKKQALTAALMLLALLLAPAALPTLAQATSTPTPTNTPTATATATSTNTTTPVLVVTGVTSNNQGYEVRRSMTAGDIAITLAWLVGIALFVFMILLDQTKRSG